VLGFLLVSCASAQSGEPAFTVITKNPDDQASIEYANGAGWIDIHSPTGIGYADLELESGIMPGEIVLRLHLKGLEQLQLISPQESIRDYVSSGGAFHITEETIVSSGTESALLPGHPLWMEIQVVSEQSEKKIPLEEGYFEVTIPREFLQKAGTSFRVEWIDFYR
jgi:hypothetical protein